MDGRGATPLLRGARLERPDPVESRCRARPARVAPWLARSAGTRRLLAVLVSLAAALALGHLPRGHPLVPDLNFRLPGLSSSPASPRISTISLPRSLPLGSFLTLRGQLPSGETGTVSVEGAYVRPPWRLLATVPAVNGSYEARFPLDHKGLLHLRVTDPDGRRSVGEVRVRKR